MLNHAQANGFYGSKGISGLIPEGYTLLEKRFWRKVLRANRAWSADWPAGPGPGIELNEWEKNGWTYHAKGTRTFLLPTTCSYRITH
jgi:CDP-diacylglycerol---glycerol-3-phosphate 3-phosphatidyltransferase